jgi:SM-20-related protein
MSPVADADEMFDQIADALAGPGYWVQPQALPAVVSQALLRLHERGDGFYSAGVGRGPDQMRHPGLRRDAIAWIREDDALAAPWIDWTRQLRLQLNQRLFLGLFSFESHLAIYQPGNFYKTHVDAFRGRSNRRVSLVAYLNRDWSPESGGELVLYHPEDGTPLQCVPPEFGTVALFLSEVFPHEVLPAVRPRLSVAGWFRVNGSHGGQVDPPA